MLVVALTGNIASGKSRVARRLAEHGAFVIDADVLAREAVEPGTPALAEIVERWGPGVLRADGHLDRAALRGIVFASSAEREALNAIVHPRVAARRETLVAEARARGERVVVCDIPLLFETGHDGDFDAVIVVHASEATRRARLLSARALSREEADRIMAAQRPSASTRSRADFVIENDGTLAALDAQVDALWVVLTRRAAALPRIS